VKSLKNVDFSGSGKAIHRRRRKTAQEEYAPHFIGQAFHRAGRHAGGYIEDFLRLRRTRQANEVDQSKIA
jgi:hypothetical protein